MIQVRFEDSRHNETEIFGPFEWVQLTYESLRIAPDGEEIAHYDGVWFVVKKWRTHTSFAFSDVVIAPDDTKAG